MVVILVENNLVTMRLKQFDIFTVGDVKKNSLKEPEDTYLSFLLY